MCEVLLKEKIEKKRMNQVFKWVLSKNEKEDYTKQLVRFFNYFGFDDEENITVLFRHEEKGYVNEGYIPYRDIKSKNIRDLKAYVQRINKKTNEPYTAEKFFITENENGNAIWFAVQGSRNPKAIKAHMIDYDKGKEIRYFKTLEKAELQKVAFENDPNDEFQSVIIIETKNSNKYKVEAKRTKQKIKQLKKEFLHKHQDDLNGALIVETKNGFHCYWFIKESDIRRFTAIQEALIRKFDSDSSVIDKARLLRIPFFFHVKDSNDPYFCKVIQWGNGEKFTQDELIELLDLNVTEKKWVKNEVKLPTRESKGVVVSSKIHFKEKFDVKLAKNKMSFMEFIDEVSKIPFSEFIENEEFQEVGFHFTCHYHEDEKPSATIQQLPDGKYVHHCFSDECDQNYRDIVNIYQKEFSDTKQPLSLSNAVYSLASDLDVEIETDEFQKYVYTELIPSNKKWIVDNLKRNVKRKKSSHLYRYLTNPYIEILDELVDVLLTIPIKQEWSYEGLPIFFASGEYLEEILSTRKRRVHRTTIINRINSLCLLGLIKKLHRNDVPNDLYKANENGNIPNYFCMSFFADIEKHAEEMAEKIKQSKITKRDLKFEEIALAFGLEKAREVFPNDRAGQNIKPKEKVTNRKVRAKVENTIEFAMKLAKETIRKKKYIKEEILLNRLKKEQFKIYNPNTEQVEVRFLYDKELESIYKKFKITFVKEGYKTVALTERRAKSFKLKTFDKSKIWIKKD